MMIKWLLRKINILMRKIKWFFQFRCLKCGTDVTDWRGVNVCICCDLIPPIPWGTKLDEWIDSVVKEYCLKENNCET